MIRQKVSTFNKGELQCQLRKRPQRRFVARAKQQTEKGVNAKWHYRQNIAISTRKKDKELIQAAGVFAAAVAIVDHILTGAEKHNCHSLCSAEWQLP